MEASRRNNEAAPVALMTFNYQHAPAQLKEKPGPAPSCSQQEQDRAQIAYCLSPKYSMVLLVPWKANFAWKHLFLKSPSCLE
eukprot:scaffold7815_cov15-Tisochrysis_lutea.AAC.1